MTKWIGVEILVASMYLVCSKKALSDVIIILALSNHLILGSTLFICIKSLIFDKVTENIEEPSDVRYQQPYQQIAYCAIFRTSFGRLGIITSVTTRLLSIYYSEV